MDDENSFQLFDETSASAAVTFAPLAMSASSGPSMQPAFPLLQHIRGPELPPASLLSPLAATADSAAASSSVTWPSGFGLVSNVTASSQTPPCDSGAFVCALLAAIAWYCSEPLAFAPPMVFMIIGTIAGNVLVVISVFKFRNLKKQVAYSSVRVCLKQCTVQYVVITWA